MFDDAVVALGAAVADARQQPRPDKAIDARRRAAAKVTAVERP